MDRLPVGVGDLTKKTLLFESFNRVQVDIPSLPSKNIEVTAVVAATGGASSLSEVRQLTPSVFLEVIKFYCLLRMV